jgi:hypothetical protein
MLHSHISGVRCLERPDGRAGSIRRAVRPASAHAIRKESGARCDARRFVIRGATVLTMDPKLGDLASGDVHVRDGAIVAVAPKIDAKAQTIEGRGMICMPGFVDTHWHLWTSLFRPFVRADVNDFGYFPVSNRLGQLMTPEDSYRAVIAPLRSPERRRHHGAQLGAQREVAGSRRRRTPRCATPVSWTLRLWSRARNADDQPMDFEAWRA